MSELRKIERPAFLAWVDAYIVEHGHPPAPEDVWFARAELDATNAVHSTHLSAVYDVFHIGSQARSIGTLLANCRNSSRRADCLSGIEQLFNYEVPDEDNPLETIEECDLNWGHEVGQYVEAFKAALPAFLTRHPEYAAHLAAEPTAEPERREVPSGDPASETCFAAAAASAVDEIKTTMPDENSPEFRAACSMAMKASQAGVGPCGVFIAGYRALRGISVDVGAPLSRASDAAAQTTASLIEILDWIVGMSTDAPITNMARRALELLNGEAVTLAAARAGATLTDASAHAMYEAAMRAMEQGGPYATLEASTAAVVRNLFAAISPSSVPETINENSHP
ncbi:hypothetical protein [Burkholderia gladioli]|uniref:hypothetical protein n=1 Tax=Burkholderia gladioli TaxID=28095 RepID=UPI001640FB21|nr:hypothetical protein [Burkholderia gladioli]